ncbi:MAG: mandelate racemase [Bacteroidetes bacterium]|nr:mandelate racemase [Bacteroidota bacterium]
MQITSVEIFKSPIKLKEPFIISLGTFEYAQNVVVVVHTDEGISGFGECSPFMPINGESMDTCFVVAQYIAKVLKGRNPLEIENCIHTIDHVIYGNTSIKSAFDIALHDIASQHANLPLYKFLGGKKDKAIQTDYTVSIGDPYKMANDAHEIAGKGFRVIKVKLGESPEADIFRIQLIREKIGLGIPLRIDANQGWKPEETLGILQKLEPYNIQFCEEPIARWDFMELPHIRKHSPIPIMADESCSNHHDAQRLLQIGACDLLNIKLGKSGGIHTALKIIEVAKNTGTRIQIGGFLESRLAFTACAHLAFVHELIQFFDFDTPLMFEHDPVVGGISYGEGGEISLSDQPGLGASMDAEYLASLEKISV